jgi:transposase
MTQKRKRLSGPEKVAIVKRYLIDRVAISDLCDEYGLQPSQIYRWQAALFEHGADVFDLKKGRRAKAAESAKDARIALSCSRRIWNLRGDGLAYPFPRRIPSHDPATQASLRP